MTRGRNDKKNNQKDISEQIFDLVMNSVDSMDFSDLSRQIRDTVNDTREEFVRQLNSIQSGYRNGKNSSRKPVSPDRQTSYGQRYRKHPGTEIVVPEKKLPGTYSGPAQIAAGGTGLAIFGSLSLGFGLSGIGLILAGSTLAAATIIAESIFLPLTLISGLLFGRGILSRNRVKRIKNYINHWKDRSFIMLSDLSEKSGQSLKQIRQDINYLLDNRFLPGARMDQEQTCLLLTDEAISQYEAAKESQRLREAEELRRQEEAARWAGASEEEKDMFSFISQAEGALTDIAGYRQTLASGLMDEKLDRLELVLTRIFVCVKDHPEKLRLTRRLMNYYIPSVMKLLSVYQDLEKQPIQGENIQKTRGEIESSLDTLNDALETMFDELFQEEALDVSADIQVLKTMLTQDGWAPSPMKPE